MKCVKCGNETRPDAKFCDACGEPILPDKRVEETTLTSTETIVEASLPNGRKIKRDWVIFGVLILAASAWVGSSVIQSSQYLSQGDAELKKGNINESIQLYKKADSADVFSIKNGDIVKSIERAERQPRYDEDFRLAQNAEKSKDYWTAYSKLRGINSDYIHYDKAIELKKIVDEQLPNYIAESMGANASRLNYEQLIDLVHQVQAISTSNLPDGVKSKVSLAYQRVFMELSNRGIVAYNAKNYNLAYEISQLFPDGQRDYPLINKYLLDIKLKREAAMKKAEEQAAAEAKKIQDEKNKEFEPKKIVDSDGKTIWKIYIVGGMLHFSGNYKGSGNFIVKLSNDNQDLISVIVNEIGDYIADKTISVPYDGWYYLEIMGSDGQWQYQWN